MSHSQFHSTNLFILRHAWLNLWDKHMTTGRINQVTTFRPAFAAIVYSRVMSTRFRDVEFVIPLWYFHQDPSQLKTGFPLGESNAPSWTHKWHHLISHSRTSQVRSPCPMKRTKVTHLQWGLPTTDDT